VAFSPPAPVDGVVVPPVDFTPPDEVVEPPFPLLPPSPGVGSFIGELGKQPATATTDSNVMVDTAPNRIC
jgi:hypothetical protein